MLSTSALLNESTVLAEGSQKTFCAAQRISSNLKTPGDNEPDNQQKRTNRLVATNHNINDVDWLQGLNEDIARIKGDPIQEISQQLKQSRKTGNTINELHIVAHGNDGDIKLGNAFLTKQYLEKSSALLQEWKIEVIYLWSCEAGLNTDLITALQECTEADIYSSKTIISRENPNIYSREENITSLEELIGFKKLRHWKGTLFAAPSNSFVTVKTGHTGTDYFRYYGPGDVRNGAGVALLEAMPWWGNATLAQQWANDSNYVSPSLNLDGDIGGNHEEVGFAYAFGGYRGDGTTEWSTKRKTDDWSLDDVTQHWSGGFAIARNALGGITLNQTGTTDGSDLLTTEARGSSTFTIVLDSAPVGADVTVSITGLATREGRLSTDTLTFTAGNWNTAQTVTVTGVDDDYDDGDRTYTLIATASNTGGYAGTEAAATTVKNTDDDTNGVTIAQTGATDGSGNLLTTEAGGSSTFTVVLDAQPSSNVTVSLTGNDTTEGLLSTSSLTFTTANWNNPQTVTVTGVDDDLDDGDITTTLTATANNAGNYAGTESDTTTFKNTDDDSNGVTIAQTGTTDGSGNLLTTEAGGSSTFTVVLDAEPTAEVTVSINGNDATEDSLSTDTLTFTTANWATAQTITVTGVDDTIVDGDITTTLTGTANNAGGYAGTESATTSVKNTDNDTTTPSPSPSPTPTPTPTQDTNQKQGDIYLLLDNSTSMLHNADHDHSKSQCLLALKAFSKDAELAGYQFQRRDTNDTFTSTQLLQTLANQTTTQAIQELDEYTIIDNPNDAKSAENLDIHLITYNYHVQHNTFTLSRTNSNSGIDIMQSILSLKMAGEQIGNAIKDNSKWKELGLPNPNRYDLFQGDPDKPSNLYSGTELLGALEGLDYLLTNKANDPNRRNQSTAISLILDGRPERRSWWDTRTNSASDSITGLPIPLPDSLGQEDITTSGLLYDTEGNPHFFKNNQGQWQWKEMQNDLNAALDLLADYSTDPNNIQVNAYGLDNTGNIFLTAAYQDLFSNQTFDNSSGEWSYSHQVINSLQDINI